MNTGGRSAEKRGSMGIRTQIVLGFGLFALIFAVLLWVFQIFLLNPFYRAIKTSEVKRTAEAVERHLEDRELDDRVREICFETGINILICDERGQLYSGWRASERDSLMNNLSFMGLAEIFNEVNMNGGSQLSTYPAPFSTQGGSSAEVILYAKIVRTDSGLNRMILMESEITPVDSTVETLKVQLICLTAAMILLAVAMSFFIARSISRPITAINDSAKQLGSGNYGISFEEKGAREVRELSQTLNFAAEELSKVEALRRDLLANVSHDLRTPLTMIKGYSEVMRDLPGENTPENVQIIIDETERLTELVNDLLDLSRLESGVAALDKTHFDLTQSIHAMLTRYDKLADYSFPFIEQGSAYVVADELRISQVVYNLVNNAIAYTGEDKTVTLHQTFSNGTVRISVTDTGDGIPPEKLKDIWERYYKVDKEHRRARVGTGLGLSIVRNILEMHGGSYGVISKLGEGSTFWFELPLASAPPPKISLDDRGKEMNDPSGYGFVSCAPVEENKEKDEKEK